MTDTRADRRPDILPESRERNAIRAALRQRATLKKSRLRDPLAYGYGKYWLILHDGTVLGCDADGYPLLSLTEVEELLAAGLDRAAAA